MNSADGGGAYGGGALLREVQHSHLPHEAHCADLRDQSTARRLDLEGSIVPINAWVA